MLKIPQTNAIYIKDENNNIAKNRAIIKIVIIVDYKKCVFFYFGSHICKLHYCHPNMDLKTFF